MTKSKKIIIDSIKEALETGKAVIVFGEKYDCIMREGRSKREAWKPIDNQLNRIILD